MFAKLPTRSYTDLAKRTKSGLLSELFHPNPNRFPEGHPYRTSLSHQDIVAKGWNPGGPALYGASTRFPTSKSSAALPQMAAVTAESVNSKNGIVGPASVKANSGPTAATTSTGSGPSMRPRGRPANVEEEDSDTDGEEDNTLSKSLVQRKLESLVASNNKRSGSASAKSPVAGVDAQSRPSASNGVMGGAMNGTRDRRQSAPEDTTPAVPITLGYPYNLPLPPPPQSPAAIRRQMLANEMSESVRRNVLWEKRQGRNFKMRQQMLTQAQAAHPHGYGYGNGNTNGINGSEGRPDDGRHNRQAYMNRNKSWAPAGNG
ncbi:hypothetical protein SISNIDRAFT_112911 [Sistotremastrum niveocremeum HHB9708]|uniref:DUF1752-domain-containing protein n=1 Tax=Sistotremastrum niveocremeum HHB9708 TaxID=1314777 RepID=A0A164TJR6_9AGAM|nr:hypothetical protein SISNIDRAFT_112911 [Sistotremastrum niveocremeum HHB9708]